MSDVDESIWEEWDECVATVIADCDKEENDSQRHGEGLLAKDGGPGWKCIEVLQRDFGHSSFRPLQWQIIKSILVDQRDNCVIMATGYGKSLTFQFPAVFKKGLSVVISPLISLMQDQVLALKMANINACYLGSAQTHKDLVMNDLLAGKIRVLYITPEYCTTTSLLQDLSSKLSITLVAIDEAHCVSQWGHDFRNSYRKLGQFRQALPNVPFLAVTATATPAVKRDICKSLCLKNPNLVCSSLDRPNLYLSASLKSNDMFSDFRKFMVKSENEKYWKFEGPTIIYCPTKKQTEEVYSTLRDRVLGCDFYHASRSLKDRTTVHENFLVDKLSVVIATVAYGMGIDKPDVRHVFHWGAPKEIESYYQEIGRAGRDGLPSKCHVFYCSRDFQLSQYFNAQGSGDIQEHRKDMCRLLERYLESKDCRRQNLLMHFEGKSSLLQKNKLQENCCDNCTTALKNGADFKEELFDFTLDAELLLKTIEALNRKGLNKVVSCIRGSKTSVISNRDLNAELHGKGKGKHENWWKALNRLLIREGYVEQQFLQFGKNEAGKGFPFPVLTLSRKGECFLSDLKENRSETSLLLPPCKEINRLVTQTRKPVPETVILSSDLPSTIVGSTTQNSLYHYLLRIRKERSAEIQCAPFHLASNQALIDLSNLRPSSVDLLRSARVDGFTDLKLQRDGLFWVTHIVDFCKENGLSIDNPQPTSTNDSAIHSLPPSAKETYEKFQRQQMEMEQIASERKVSKSTLVNHLCQALKVGLPLDFHRAGVPDFAQEKIISVISKPPINNVISKVKPIKEQCPDYINYDQIHLVVSYLIGLETIKKVTVCENVSTMDKFDIDSPSTSSAQLKGFTSSLKEHKSQTTLPTVWESKSSFSQAHNSKEKISKSHWKLQYDLCADDEESGQDPHDATNEEQCDYPQGSSLADLRNQNCMSPSNLYVEKKSCPEDFDVSGVDWDCDIFDESEFKVEIDRETNVKPSISELIIQNSSVEDNQTVSQSKWNEHIEKEAHV